MFSAGVKDVMEGLDRISRYREQRGNTGGYLLKKCIFSFSISVLFKVTYRLGIIA